MLQQPALETWAHPDAEAYRAEVTYTGVFIPTDLSWKTQIESLGAHDFSDQDHQLFEGAAFTVHVLHALATAMIYRVHRGPAAFSHRRADLPWLKEQAIVKEISSIIGVSPALPTLISLKHALGKRLTRLREVAVRERVLQKEGRRERLAMEQVLKMWYLEPTISCIEVFNDAVGEPRARWALLFDELELAPEWIREQLVNATRSVDERILFKLSLSPYDENVVQDSMLAPMQDNDYDAIALWHASREDGYNFCAALWQSLLSARGHSEATAEATLGPSIFDATEVALRTHGAYGPRSSHRRRFRDLAKKDRTFADYLSAKGLDVNSLEEGDENARASEIRKIISIVATRETYRVPDDSKGRQRVRSRKNPKLYVGAKSVFAMVEGNPRWLIAIGSRLLQGSDDEGRIPEAVQSRELMSAAHRFQAMLETVPVPKVGDHTKVSGVADLVGTIGEYFFRAVVLEDFNPDPPGSFIVDSNLHPDVVSILGRALNVGAIVYVPRERESVLVGDLIGKRFRLCYLLAPIYRFPIRLGREVSLSTIIRAMSEEGAHQTTLFK
ncbi:MAG: hypothetical protein DWQ37_19860 [Planctomycetota bacterium]|nr:MAG: hypothetical protein DWQ37_19860 [Planctomycetota bacterium]